MAMNGAKSSRLMSVCCAMSDCARIASPAQIASAIAICSSVERLMRPGKRNV